MTQQPDELVHLNITTYRSNVPAVLAAAAVKPEAAQGNEADTSVELGEGPSNEEWSSQHRLIRMAFVDSPENMLKVWVHLAKNAERAVSSEELRKELGLTKDQLAGVFGAFGRRWANRYGRRNMPWPFSSSWSASQGQRLYTMPQEVADIILSTPRP